MALRLEYAKWEEVPAEHSSHTVEKRGAFVLDVDGAVERERLDEFRQSNAGLLKRLKDYEGIDPSSANDLMARHAVTRLREPVTERRCGEDCRGEGHPHAATARSGAIKRREAPAATRGANLAG